MSKVSFKGNKSTEMLLIELLGERDIRRVGGATSRSNGIRDFVFTKRRKFFVMLNGR